MFRVSPFENGQISSSKLVASFIGFAPVENPQFVCLIVVDEPQVPQVYGSTVAAPFVQQVLAAALSYAGVTPDIDSSIALLNGVFDVVYTVPVNNPRSISAEELAEKYRSVCGDVQSFGNVYEAFDNAVDRARAETFAVVICGSLYLAGEIRPHAKSVL